RDLTIPCGLERGDVDEARGQRRLQVPARDVVRIDDSVLEDRLAAPQAHAEVGTLPRNLDIGGTAESLGDEPTMGRNGLQVGTERCVDDALPLREVDPVLASPLRRDLREAQE